MKRFVCIMHFTKYSKDVKPIQRCKLVIYGKEFENNSVDQLLAHSGLFIKTTKLWSRLVDRCYFDHEIEFYLI